MFLVKISIINTQKTYIPILSTSMDNMILRHQQNVEEKYLINNIKTYRPFVPTISFNLIVPPAAVTSCQREPATK